MSAELTYTERELVLAMRQAVLHTVERLRFDRFLDTTSGRWYGAATLSERLYPLPKVERPRVVRDSERSGYAWRVIAGRLQARFVKSEWRDGLVWLPTPERVALWADLLAHPTELVDDDGAEDGV